MKRERKLDTPEKVEYLKKTIANLKRTIQIYKSEEQTPETKFYVFQLKKTLELFEKRLADHLETVKRLQKEEDALGDPLSRRINKRLEEEFVPEQKPTPTTTENSPTEKGNDDEK